MVRYLPMFFLFCIIGCGVQAKPNEMINELVLEEQKHKSGIKSVFVSDKHQFLVTHYLVEGGVVYSLNNSPKVKTRTLNNTKHISHKINSLRVNQNFTTIDLSEIDSGKWKQKIKEAFEIDTTVSFHLKIKLPCEEIYLKQRIRQFTDLLKNKDYLLTIEQKSL